MKVGDYVRTINGEIYKLIDDFALIYFQKEQEHGIPEHQIIKSSPNIIDLIEENDLIEIEYKISTGENQKEIVQVIKNVNNKLFIKTYTEHYVFIEDIEKTIYKIKGIITHEQIESMKYKVKE